MRTINEYALDLVNFYYEVSKFELGDYAKLDVQIRDILIKDRLHLN